jgi:hypothetical protein
MRKIVPFPFFRRGGKGVSHNILWGPSSKLLTLFFGGAKKLDGTDGMR